ncbi:nucleotide pyrophosphohydrolase [Candidatus Woesearchaeota archaeon]|nr:nucleotide pyrophosphohydrolase [Candidatus Woesearchaeota archaeon]
MQQNFQEFVQLIEQLRSENGCPWDKEQTFITMKEFLIEEAQEIADAIDKDDIEEVKKELGDLILNILLVTQIAKEKNLFDINDVLSAIREKVVRRHPHVFGDVKVNSIEEIRQNWEKIKLIEKEEKRLKKADKGESNG